MIEMGGGAVRQHHLERASIPGPCNACFLAADNFWAANAAEISKLVYQQARSLNGDLIK